MSDTNFSYPQLIDVLPGVIHEINNPLGALIMNIAILREDTELSALNPEEKESLIETYDDMDNALQKIKDFVQSLGYLSVQRFYDEPTGIDLKYVINHSINLFHNKLKRVVRTEVRQNSNSYLFVNIRITRVIIAFLEVLSQLVECDGEKIILFDCDYLKEDQKVFCEISRKNCSLSMDLEKLTELSSMGDFSFEVHPGKVIFKFAPHEQISI
ncbi:MAG: hypothetical protein JXR95_05185 [Deltaproteobacteria bacterium]|nr:hypothetical protein [Deltaproteobacteria bacterium]